MSTAELENLANGFPGELGVYAKRLDDDTEVTINADVPFYLASVAKVLIMVGAVDLMNRANDLTHEHEIELYDYREEGKRFRFHHIGTTQTYHTLLRRMIANSDTTATDMVVRIAGATKINRRLDALGIPGLGEVTSIAELTRIISTARNDRWAEVPAYALESYLRGRNRDFLVPAHLSSIPANNGSAAAAYEAYYRSGLNSATPRAMGRLAERLAEESLLGTSWKNDILREEIFDAGGEGWIGGAVPSVRLVDTKGGDKSGVKCELGIVYDGTTPEAVIGVFTQKLEIPRPDAGPLIRIAANLAYNALGFTHPRPAPSVPSPGLVFTQPEPGRLFEPGEQPPIAWASNGISGRLTLRLVTTDSSGNRDVVDTLSTEVIDDGEWHSFDFPADIPPGRNHRFELTSNDDDSIVANSNYFAVRGVIRVTEPHLGRVVQHGETPTIRWATRGVQGDLTIEVYQGEVLRATLSTIAIDDGEWHSWTVDDSLPEDDNYQIRVRSNADPAVVGSSPRFTIGGRIDVTSPLPERVIAVGTRPTIRWRTEGVDSNVTVRLFRGRETAIETISSSAIDDGQWHSWTAPTSIPDGLGYRFEVAKKNDGDIRGTSHYVQIGSRLEWLVPSIEQQPFNGDDHARPSYFAHGTSPQLRWRTIGELTGRLRLELLHRDSVVQTISTEVINDGEWHSWTVADDLPASSHYRFRLTSKDRPGVQALSQPFHLGAMVDITLPTDENLSPQTTLHRGDQPNILWRTANVDGNLELKLFRNDDPILTIASNAFDDGEWHSWTVPDDVDVASGYRFKLTSKINPDVFGFSPWFRIQP